jgi:hypothetical protein
MTAQKGANTVARIFGRSSNRCADIAVAQEFHQIQKFAAACRRRWPGAMIVLRPNEGGPPQGADAAPPNQNPHQKGPDHVSGI